MVSGWSSPSSAPTSVRRPSKLILEGTKVEKVTVNGQPGWWVEGGVHAFFYRDATGEVVDTTLRLVGSTLLWEEAGVAYRVEGRRVRRPRAVAGVPPLTRPRRCRRRQRPMRTRPPAAVPSEAVVRLPHLQDPVLHEDRRPARNRRRRGTRSLTPQIAGQLVAAGNEVLVQARAGEAAFLRTRPTRGGATRSFPTSPPCTARRSSCCASAASDEEIDMLRPDAVLIGTWNPVQPKPGAAGGTGITAISMDAIPHHAGPVHGLALVPEHGRGYKAVPRPRPGCRSSSRCSPPRRAPFVRSGPDHGGGVAGLMAIGTARRLGAVVEAFDVRPVVKEQVESLGATFVEVPMTDEEKASAQTAGGYAREMSEDYQRRQRELIAERVQAADFVITTALIPGRPAPKLITADMVRTMQPGSVIVDMAAEAGGNTELTELARRSWSTGDDHRPHQPAGHGPDPRHPDVRQERPDPGRPPRPRGQADPGPRRRDHEGRDDHPRRQGRPRGDRRRPGRCSRGAQP